MPDLDEDVARADNATVPDHLGIEPFPVEFDRRVDVGGEEVDVLQVVALPGAVGILPLALRRHACSSNIHARLGSWERLCQSRDRLANELFRTRLE